MLKKLTAAGVVAAAVSGALVFTSPANAGINNTSGDGSILGGNQVNVPISIPVNVCGNAIAVIGGARAGCRGGAAVGYGAHHHGYHWDS
ncbi:chaplin family protein [Actinoallomurus iriomotensis]|uniref:chaplin family protein n=1 Tax=Actinoallomurus TaxID=667113 RepID=UPI00255641DF|nr:chaplin family protein [Actinoallomurus iriomotensis]